MGNFLSSPITEKETHVGMGNGLSYAVSCMQGWRATMEDAHIARTTLPAFDNCSIFAVFDGHGGKLIADHSAMSLTDVLEKQNINGTEVDPLDIGKALGRAFLQLDDEHRTLTQIVSGEDHSGCTAIAAFVTHTHIIVANSGDSRGVLATDGGVVPMSYDHKPNNEKERLRIENAGGSVRNNRVSRALGDFVYKQRPDLKPEEQQVSAEPDLKVEVRNKENEFLILACDGIWDVMTNEDACDFVRGLMNQGESNMGLICEEMLDHCLQLGSRDNMSVVIVKFSGAKIGTGEGVMGLRKAREKAAEEAKKQEQSEHNYSAATSQ
ncbi:protein phosphatase 2C [Achlya hypogyna]|uniref:Protein phosphatase 2C n=1 Tax=Achlya hypogyna TaxID=1202772 RepID=A0A1V9YXK3_ACHHY|nr:protein phosphatase 2C [Achlya hypogyna]